MYIKTSMLQHERYRMQEEKVIFDYKAEWGTLCLPNRAHQFQVYSAAVASADNIATNKTPLVISPTKEDSTSDPKPQILNQECGYNCVRLLPYTYGQRINVLKLFAYV
jgi:hypothetical protein